MARRLLSALAALLLCFAAVSAEAQRRDPSAADIERARQLFVEGTEHYQAGRLNEALERFLAAWRIVPGPELAYNVARTYERMADAQHAVEFYRHYLRQAASGRRGAAGRRAAHRRAGVDRAAPARADHRAPLPPRTSSRRRRAPSSSAA
ncbi:MAG: hypothetical protein M5U28_00870 [Sandaracinaceae bacterium]|nr:hypothetical protein [Sandaracinaceae bacterium]